jgi:hypothetical protein
MEMGTLEDTLRQGELPVQIEFDDTYEIPTYPGVYLQLVTQDSSPYLPNLFDQVVLVFSVALLDRYEYHVQTSVSHVAGYPVSPVYTKCSFPDRLNMDVLHNYYTVIFYEPVSLDYLEQVWVLSEDEALVRDWISEYIPESQAPQVIVLEESQIYVPSSEEDSDSDGSGGGRIIVKRPHNDPVRKGCLEGEEHKCSGVFQKYFPYFTAEELSNYIRHDRFVNDYTYPMYDTAMDWLPLLLEQEPDWPESVLDSYRDLKAQQIKPVLPPRTLLKTLRRQAKHNRRNRSRTPVRYRRSK